MSGRRPGRPPRKWKVNGRAAIAKTFNKLRTALSPSPPPSEAIPPATGGTRLTGEAAHTTLLASQSYGTRPERNDARERPVFLDKVANRKDAKARKLLATIPTEDCPQWFDNQYNDFVTKGPSVGRAVDVKWFGHPGDSAHDIRARKFVVRWSKYLGNPDIEMRKRAIKEEKVVCRWKYYCSGLHDREIDEDNPTAEGDAASNSNAAGDIPDIPDTDLSPEEAAELAADPDANISSGEGSPDEPDRWNKCSGGVRLYCEITADDLTHVKIWQVGEHEDAPASFPFAFSRHLRLVIMEWLRRYDLVNRFERRDTSGKSEPLPSHRIPTSKQIRQMIPAERHRMRLDRNPFRATHLMVDRNPDKMYYYTPHDFSKPDNESKFSVAITDAFSLDSTILNTAGRDGALFMDSTHRLHNENRAATTVLCTANSNKHMMPGAYLLSANIKADTIKQWLLDTIAKIEARAREIVAGMGR
ncbi:hypothetical protein B0H11DRAFT_2427045 [Mycena galericulata]|nr:hypothetical protein B0H11DRAFT_2427045 [Mycena galericulata]